jgi:electron transport complex protein RnfC
MHHLYNREMMDRQQMTAAVQEVRLIHLQETAAAQAEVRPTVAQVEVRQEAARAEVQVVGVHQAIAQAEVRPAAAQPAAAQPEAAPQPKCPQQGAVARHLLQRTATEV